MKALLAVVILSITIISCRPYTSTRMKPNQITYQDFRSEQRTFSSSEGVIKYIDKGEGPVLLLLHGVPTSGWLYRNFIDSLSQQYRVIVPDMLGFGSSASPEGYEIYSEENHAKRIVALMDSLEIDQWNHLMHDAGGLWTWELIKKHPDKISKLVILNTIIYSEGFDPPVRMKKGFIARTAMWAYRNGITTNILLKSLFKSGMLENDLNEQDVEGYKTPLKEGKTKGMYYFFTQTCNELTDYSEQLKNFNKPVAVIWGENDEFLLWEPQKDRVIQDLDISEENIHILNAKHFIQEEKPEKIISTILDFLK